jgi:hypothetical protein
MEGTWDVNAPLPSDPFSSTKFTAKCLVSESVGAANLSIPISLHMQPIHLIKHL